MKYLEGDNYWLKRTEGVRLLDSLSVALSSRNDTGN